MQRIHRYLPAALALAVSTVAWADSPASAGLKQRVERLEQTVARMEAKLATDCSGYPQDYVFDVYFQGQTRKEVVSALHKAQAAGLKDLFAAYDVDRLYVGRYGPCALAERRRAAVHAQTGLPLRIAAAPPDQQPPARAIEPSPPFTIAGVEVRGARRYIGIAPPKPKTLGDITWLLPGQSYRGWRLQAIDAHTATFVVDGQPVTVDLPE